MAKLTATLMCGSSEVTSKHSGGGFSGMDFNEVLPFSSGVTLGKSFLFGSSIFLTCKWEIP